VVERDEAAPPLRVLRAGAEVHGLVARDADFLLIAEHGEHRDEREGPADDALLARAPAQLHWRASAAKQMWRFGSSALAMNVTSAGPGVVGAANRTQPSSTPGVTDATTLPPISTASLPGPRGERRVKMSASPA